MFTHHSRHALTRKGAFWLIGCRSVGPFLRCGFNTRDVVSLVCFSSCLEHLSVFFLLTHFGLMGKDPHMYLRTFFTYPNPDKLFCGCYNVVSLLPWLENKQNRIVKSFLKRNTTFECLDWKHDIISVYNNASYLNEVPLTNSTFCHLLIGWLNEWRKPHGMGRCESRNDNI